jgi:hypothetical protein
MGYRRAAPHFPKRPKKPRARQKFWRLGSAELPWSNWLNTKPQVQINLRKDIWGWLTQVVDSY